MNLFIFQNPYECFKNECRITQSFLNILSIFFFNSEESEHYSKTLLILVQKLVQHECKPKQYSEYSMPRLTHLLQEIIEGQRPSIEGQSQFVIN